MKVFLSSTAQDLVAYRQVADDTILRLSQQAVVMERFGPLPGAPVEECERLARECDVTVCIVAHRYGFEPEKGRGSITRREVEAANAAGRDVLVWIVADDHPWTEPREQDLIADPRVIADDERVAEIRAGVAGLLAFKAWLRNNFTPETFTTPDDLGRKIAIALSDYLHRHARDTMPVRPKQGEIRIVHALQPAPHFHGREAVVKELTDWVADAASPDRVWALVAAGGTGKTAIVERVVREMQPGEANVLVWSFYERPEADAFLRECNQLFLGEEDGPAGGRLERLERGLRDGRPHLIVLDGLERVQEDAGSGRVRGELSDQTLKLLLQVLAAGLGRTRALVTSRFLLVDLQDWEKRGYRETRLDDLTPEAAVAVLRGWKVAGDDAALRAAASQVGYHALSVAVIGSYLQSFAHGKIEAVRSFDLDLVTGDDPKAAKLARVLAFYAERLPVEERELMTRLSVFPRGVTGELLGSLIDAGGEVAGALVGAGPRLLAFSNSLKARGLVFAYRTETEVAWTAHPFLRETFRDLLGCPIEQVFQVVSASLGKGLESRSRPGKEPTDLHILDRFEHLIEATRLAGWTHEAFDLYRYGLGAYRHLAGTVGDFERGYRILAPFSPTGRPEDLGARLRMSQRSLLARHLSLFASRLGRLTEARAIRRLDEKLESSGDPVNKSICLSTSSRLALNMGRLDEARRLASEALDASAEVDGTRTLLFVRALSLNNRARAWHAMGDVESARADLAEYERTPRLTDEPAIRHHVDLGNFVAARALADRASKEALRKGQNHRLVLL